jgi:hypothetical protein
MGLFDIFKKKTPEEEFGEMPELGGEGFPPIETGFPGPEMGGMPGVPRGRGFPPPMGPPTGAPQMPPATVPPAMQPIQPVSMQFSGPYGMPPQPQPQMDIRQVSDMVRSQVEVLSSKIDTMRATLDRINERLDYIERYLIGRR